MNTKLLGLIIVLIALCVWPFLYQKARLSSEKRLEVFKICADSIPSDLAVSFEGMKLHLGACDTLIDQF